MHCREDRQAGVSHRRPESAGKRHKAKISMRSEKRRHHVLVFNPAQRTGGVDEPAAGPDVLAELMQEGALFFRRPRYLLLGRGPFEVGRATPGTGTAARRIDQHAIVQPLGNGGQHLNRLLRPCGAHGKFLEGRRANIEGVDRPGRPEEPRQLQGLSARAGTRVQPCAAFLNSDRLEEQL
jgi:hypothetical protein